MPNESATAALHFGGEAATMGVGHRHTVSALSHRASREPSRRSRANSTPDFEGRVHVTDASSSPDARLTVRVPRSLADGFRSLAERDERTVSQELRRLIRGRVDDESIPAVRHQENA